MQAAEPIPTGAPVPVCPLTGEPPLRLVHSFAAKSLMRLWRGAGAGDVERLFPGRERLGLYESTTGLYFFDPMTAGDAAFYGKFYASVGGHRVLNSRLMSRVEYIHAARLVPDQGLVLDVGCGMGGFKAHLPHARYQGLDPYAPEQAPAYVLRETPAEHLRRNAGRYDVVSAFQVLEHVPDPRQFTETLVSFLRPGGLLILVAPLHPSPLTEMPNFVLNAPPHHLTWWNRRAYAALASLLGLETVEITELPPSPHAALVFWMHKLSFARSDPPPGECYFQHRWSWHLSMAVSYALARVADRLLDPPDFRRPVDVLLAARRP
jgi:SAM-dependent methyltransferase